MLAIEPLAIALLRDKKISGISLFEKIFKVGQYADDTFLLVDAIEKSLRYSLDLFNNFYLCSGLKLNFDKTSMDRSKRILCPELNLS